MTQRLAIVNTGASTLKIAVLDVGTSSIRIVQRIEQRWVSGQAPDATVNAALDRLESIPEAFGHRIVHGGTDFVEPVLLTAEVERELEALLDLAPLHNSVALAAMRVVGRRFPALPAVGVFDTAFHANRPHVSMQYALPRSLVERFGFRRYGFHGLAHASLVEALAREREAPTEEIAAVTLQLGGGCSACAVREGRSLETSMGYTPLEGLIMGTRSGDVDPAIVLRLVRAGYGADHIEQWLTRGSGLEALCGTSDMREILAAEGRGDEAAGFAVEMFCHRIVLTVGAYFTLLNGRGALVFGGGIGTNAPAIRNRVGEGLRAWGVEIDAQRNDANLPGLISTALSRPVYVLQTDEESVMARAVARHLVVRR
jgi:acetate kinase